MRLSKVLFLLLILASPVYAGEICRIYPGGGGDGIGDISVSRASSATGISLLGEIQTWGSNLPTFRDGRVQSLPTSGYTNLLEYSEDFTLWTASNISLSANLVGPDNQTNSGYTATATAGNGTLKYTSTTTTSQDYNYSIWMRRITGTGNIDLTLDDGSTWTTQTLSSDWQRFDIAQSLASPVVGIRIVTDTDAIGIFGAQETATVYQLPYVPTSGSTVSVAGEARTIGDAPNALIDALRNDGGYDTDGESIVTILAKVILRADPAVSGGAVVLRNGRYIIYTSASSDDYRVFDGTNTASAYSSDADPVSGDEYWIKVTADSTDGASGSLQFCDSQDQGLTWNCGTGTNYDGSFESTGTFYVGSNSELPFEVGPIIFYDEILTNAQATAALRQNQKAAGMAAAVPSLGGGADIAAGASCPEFYADDDVVFSWDGDHSLGTNYGCNSGGGGISGTNTDLTISILYGESGSNGAIIDTIDEHLQWADTGDQYIDDVGPQTIFLRVYVYEAPVTTQAYIFESNSGSNDDVILLRITNGATRGSGNYRANDLSETSTGTEISVLNWHTIGYSWDYTNGDHSFYTEGTGWAEDANELVTPMTGNLSAFGLGEEYITGGTDGVVYIDRFALVNGYEASEPTNW